MSAVTFDTHRFVKRLRETGMPEKQAEEVVDIVSEVREESYTALATKKDLEVLRKDLEVLRHEVINKVGIMLIGLGFLTITSFAGCLAFFVQYIKH